MKSKRKVGFIPLLWTIFKQFMKRNPGALILYIVCGILSGGFLAFSSLFKENFFNAVEDAMNGSSINVALISGIVMGGVLVLTIVFSLLFSVVEENFFAKLSGNLGFMLNVKASKIEPICYEDNKLLDNINKAQKGLDSASKVFGSFCYIFFNMLPFFIVIALFFVSIKVELIIMIATSFIPCIIACILRYKIFKKSEKKAAPYRRKYEYYSKCITEKEYAKETRLLGGFGYFYRLFKDTLNQTTNIQLKAIKHDEINELIAKILIMIGYISTLGAAVYFLVKGEIRIGAFAAIISCLDTLFDYLENVFNYCIGSIFKNMPFAKNYQLFMNLPERTGKNHHSTCESFALSNLSFKYPSANDYALKNINLKINKNDSIAIVGENGAGKSTLVKILLGLYLPTEGLAEIDGIETKDIDQEYLYKYSSGVFQNFIKYKLSLKDNVYLSNTFDEFDRYKFDKAITKSNFDMDGIILDNGIDTVLSKEFGNVDLSGGQWQRLAIARGLYKNYNFIVLDEPTAAIDPLEEKAVYNKFIEMSKGKTSIIVTHRLASARLAKRIVVMKNGEIDDIGTHDELMNKKGYYFELFTSQAKWYI